MNDLVTLISVGYQHSDWLERYMDGIVTHESGTPLEIIVVDVMPQSTPNLPEHSLYISLYQSSYAHAINEAFKRARGRYIIWGNDDLIVNAPFIEDMLAPIREERRTITGLWLLHQHNRAYIEGCLTAMPYQALDEIGLLDESLPGCFEDVDYSWRATEAGYRLVQTSVPVQHVDCGRLDHKVGESHSVFRKKWHV